MACFDLLGPNANAYSRVALALPSRQGFFSTTSCGKFLDLRPALDRARRVRHNKGVYGERSEPRSVLKKKKVKKKKMRKNDHFGDFVGSNRRPPGVNQTPRAVQ